jgi:uncharacterized protein involved in exopolysaccharide biosynthesis
MTDDSQRVEAKNSYQSSQICPTAPPDYDDEINLLDLFLVLLKRKWLIIGFVFFAGVAAVGMTLLMTNIYRSDATILPKEEEKTPSSMLSSALGGLGSAVAADLGLGGSGTLEKLQVVLKSRYLAQRVIEKYDLMPTVLPDRWDETTKKWKTKKWFGLVDMELPTLQDGVKELTENLLNVTSDSTMGTLKVSIDYKDPLKAKSVVEYLLIETSETMREVVLRDAAENIKFFAEQLERTTDPLLRAKIYDSLAREIEKETFAKAQKYYGFYVPDPPFAPDLNKKAKPQRALICVLSVFVAFFIAAFLTFLLEYFSRIKTKDPDRYQMLRDGLRLRRKRSRQSKEQKV